jgi:hypothetical protein
MFVLWVVTGETASSTPGRHPNPNPMRAPAWRQLTPHHWSGTWNSKIRGTIALGVDGWLTYVRFEDPPGLSPITTVSRYATVEEAQAATDEVWAAR